MDNADAREGIDKRCHARKVTGLFSHIAGMYDAYNRVFSLGFDALWRNRLVELVEPVATREGAVLLDLAAGTLEVTKKLSKKYPHARILAADFCPSMVEAGMGKVEEERGRTVLPLVADALALPLADASVDGLTVAFGVRNFKPRETALEECCRVLKPGGRLCILEFGSAQDKILFGLYNWYLRYVLPFFGKLLSKDEDAYQYLADSIVAFPSADSLAEECRKAGFAKVRHQKYTAGIVRIHICDKEASR